MAGYTRNDTSNNIANGNVINAADLDGEFDALDAAFDETTGHVHDGSANNGAPITKVGPFQDVVVSSSAVTPKTDNTVDLGSSSNEFKDLYIDGIAYLDGANIESGSATTFNAVTLTAASATMTVVDINGGAIDGTAIGANSASTGAFTTLTSNSTTTLNGTSIPASKTLVDTNTAQTLTNKTLTSPTLTTPVLGTPSSGTLTSCTGLPLTTGVTGTLPVANGGTGATTLTGVLKGNGTSAFTAATAGTDYVAPGGALGTPSSGTLTNATGLPIVNGTTGTLSVARGGTGVTTSTGTGNVVLSTSPTLTTPNLGTPSAATLTNATGLPLSTGVTGTLPLANGGTGASLSDPNADRILFWDDSAGAVTYLEAGSGLSISGTTISATGAGGSVTSVGLTMPTGFTVTGSPVTSSGTLAVSTTLSGVLKGTGSGISAATAGTDFVAPGGALGTPSSGTLTNCTSLPIVNGTTGTLSVARGGTGQTAYTDGQLLIGNTATGGLSKATLTAGTNVTITNGNGTITIAASGGTGTGDVTGPASSVDENIVRFNGTTGKIIEDSGFVCTSRGRTNTLAVGSTVLSNGSLTATNNVVYGINVGADITTDSGNVLLGLTISGLTNAAANGGNVGVGNAVNFNSALEGVVLLGSAIDTDNIGETYSVVVGHNITGKGSGTGMYGGANGVYNEANSASWSTVSDERIKKNIVDSPLGLAQINQLRVRSYNYKTNEEMPFHPDGKPFAKNLDTTKTITGFIAQEIQQVMPCCVRESERGVLSVNNENVIFALVNAVKELSAEVEALKAQLNA